MKAILSDLCNFVEGSVNVADLTRNTYISTENMLPDKGGIRPPAELPKLKPFR